MEKYSFGLLKIYLKKKLDADKMRGKVEKSSEILGQR